MATPLLKTKLYIPPARPEMVSRPRLIERLNAGLHRKLTLISAPAGFGKTTLLSEWVAGCECPVAWLSLDEGDNDPARFLAYFVAALQTIHDDLGEAALAMLQSPQPPPIESLLTGLINEIAALPGPGDRESCPYVLVLDDYHLITARPIHEAVTFLLDHLPPQMHLIIATRADPPLPLARLRARGEMIELRANDLRFTPDEAASFLNDVMGLELSAEDIAALDARTEGWIVGLQMAALSMRGRKDVSGFIRTFTGSHHFILDYLVEEVLEQQPSDIRAFLLKTSILERMTADLCDAVLEIGDWRSEIADHIQSPCFSQEMLERLERANLFVIPLDDERRWYRYHHLFADLLRNQLALAYPDQVSCLHQRASGWFEEEGFTEETIAHAFAAKDYERVASLVEKYARDMLHQSKYNILVSWLEALPKELVQTRPWLCVYQSWTRHWAGTREGGEECLENAEQVLSSLPPSGEPEEQPKEILSISEEEKRLIPGYIATVRAHYALTNEEIPRVLEQAQKALRLLPEDDYFTRGTAAIALGGAYWGMGDVSGAEQAFAERAANALKGGYHYRASSALCYAGMQQVKQARLLKAQETFRDALALAQGPGGRRFPNAGYPLVKLGELACEWNDLESARRDVDEGVELCTQLGHADLLAEAYAALARVQLAQRDFASVKDTLQRGDQLSRGTKLDPWAVCWLDDCRLRLWLSAGQLDEAIRWAQTSGLSVDGDFRYHHDLHHINLARVLIARAMQQPSGPHLNEALRLLGRLLEAAEAAGWVHEAIKVLILQALALQARGDRKEALAALARALTLAEPAGYVRTFIDEGAPMGTLLRQAVARGIAVDYVGKLLAVLESETRPSPSPLIEPLSEREMEVLRLLTTSLSSTEIAQELFISVNTVRSHIKSIYDKLNVHRRRDAVQRARELGLL
jgi:LuxR family maltose regulon positive regulatory protein